MPNDETSLSLLRRLSAPGDASAWNRFNDLYGPWIEGWLRRQGVPEDVCEDVRQEALAKVFAEIAGFNHNGRTGAFRAWLRNVTHFRLRTIQRQRYRADDRAPEWSAVADALADDHSGVSKLWNAEYDRYMVRRLLELVEPEFQPATLAAFRRVVIDEQDVSVVAGDLGMTPNAVRIAQSRVLAALRRVGEGMMD